MARTNARLAAAVGCVLAIALVAGAWASWNAFARPNSLVSESSTQVRAYARLGQGIENVALMDHRGARVTWAQLNSRPRVVFFGFTHCPNVCPMTLAGLQAAMDEARLDEEAVYIDFVSLDPARDTSHFLNDYLSGFGPNVRGFTGAMADLTAVAHAYRASFARTELANGDYTIDHATGVYFLDTHGRVVTVLNYDAAPTDMARALRSISKQS